MNCHITIHNKDNCISIRGKWEELKKFLPIQSAESPEYLCFRDNSRQIEVVVTPETPSDAKIGIDLARQYLNCLKEKSGEIVAISRKELSQIIRQLETAGKSI